MCGKWKPTLFVYLDHKWISQAKNQVCRLGSFNIMIISVVVSQVPQSARVHSLRQTLY